MSTHFKTTACRPVYSAHKPRRTGVLGWILTLASVWRERRILQTMERHRLDDLGLSREDANREARRNAWDAPDRWLQ